MLTQVGLMPIITVHMCIVARGCKVFKWSKEGSVRSGLGQSRFVGTGAIMVKDVVRVGKVSGRSLICRFVTEAKCGHGPQGHHGIKASFGLRFVARASCTGHCVTKANFGQKVDRCKPSVGTNARRCRCHHRHCCHRCRCTLPVSSLHPWHEGHFQAKG